MSDQPARFEGVVHDRVILWSGDEYKGDFVVIAGADEADTVGLQISTGALHVSMHVLPQDATALGRLLIAAGQDTMSRNVGEKDAGTDESETT